MTGLVGGAAALVLRTHHAVIDGIGTMQLLQILVDTEPTPVDLDQVAQPVEGRCYPSLLRRALFEIPNRVATDVVTTGRIVKNVGATVPRVMLGTPARVVRQAAPKFGSLLRLQQLPEPAHLPGYIPSPSGHPPVTVFNHYADNPRKSMAVISLPWQQSTGFRARGFPDVTVNDILFALVTGALRDYLTDHDDLPDRPLRTTCRRASGCQACPPVRATTSPLSGSTCPCTCPTQPSGCSRSVPAPRRPRTPCPSRGHPGRTWPTWGTCYCREW